MESLESGWKGDEVLKRWACRICNTKFGISNEKRSKEENYICPDCAGKIRKGMLVMPRVFGRKSKQRAKRKALKVGKQLSA